MRRPERTIVWGHSSLTAVIVAESGGPARLIGLDSTDAGSGADRLPAAGSGQPLVELLVGGEGTEWSGARSVDSALGRRLRYVGHEESTDGRWRQLVIDLVDAETDLAVRVWFRSVDGLSAVQTWCEVRADGSEPVTLHAVSSFASGAVTGAGAADSVVVRWGDSDWLAEGRWHRAALREEGLPDVDLQLHGQIPRGCLAVTSNGSWSSGVYLPTGVLEDTATGRACAWQIEHNGAWRWEIGERLDGIYLAAMGPTDTDHQWHHVLEPGQTFVTVPVGIAVGTDGYESAIGALTRYRREISRPHPDRDRLPVIFNDYMNTLLGDPTTDKLLPLVEAAARIGAEYFCVDAGWYAEDGGWWETVGAWRPSSTRFPRGLGEVMDRIRAAGMRPGLWLEPEVVGVRSPVADELPEDAFFQRGSRRQVEHGRYHLDLRHPAAIAQLDATVDRLVDEFGVGYLKLDYNINPRGGTDVKAASAGDGLLGHNRALLRWLDGLAARHPDLVLENCASGGMRMDYAMLARLQLQSTSDQRNPTLYPPIAAAAPMSVAPEQSANWAYPQPHMSAEEVAFTLCTGILGRLYLSGHVDRMRDDQLALVTQGVTVHKSIRADLARALPFWPLGLPEWNDDWICLGLQAGPVSYLVLWQRSSATADVRLPIPHLMDSPAQVEVLYPNTLQPWQWDWDAATATLTAISKSDAPAARVVRLTSLSRDDVIDPTHPRRAQ
jgi:alpha-galactosidase